MKIVHYINNFLLLYRAANEKLGNKIREQSKAIVQLAAEKEYVFYVIYILKFH